MTTELVGLPKHVRKSLTNRETLDEDKVAEGKHEMRCKIWLEPDCIEGDSCRETMTICVKLVPAISHGTDVLTGRPKCAT